jgi:hypothetical protein
MVRVKNLLSDLTDGLDSTLRLTHSNSKAVSNQIVGVDCVRLGLGPDEKE